MDYISSNAIIDPTGEYRYSLTRIFNKTQPKAVFLLLNPSTADCYKDDPTVLRCKGFALNWGCGSFEIVNLFAYRATNPRELLAVENPIGPENDKYILKAVRNADLVVAAWGTHGKLLDRNQQVLKLLKNYDISCFGLTKCGNPKHPLYLPNNIDLACL